MFSYTLLFKFAFQALELAERRPGFALAKEYNAYSPSVLLVTFCLEFFPDEKFSLQKFCQHRQHLPEFSG